MTWLRMMTIACVPVLGGCTRENPLYGGGDEATGTASTDVSTGDALTEDAADPTGGSGGGQSTGSTVAVCGDGVVEGDEVCDDGVNDGGYGSCRVDCSAPASFCGDGVTDEPFETCDDDNDDLADGCLPDCIVPGSCLEILQSAPAPADGVYLIHPAGNRGDPFEVYCDMSTDGGGYTFYKIEHDTSLSAPFAEQMCEGMGMQLWIPRTEGHRASGVEVANDARFGPSADDAYLVIMGIYPQFPGAACVSQPLNSDNPTCDWEAGDGGPFWVDDHSNFNEPNGNFGDAPLDGSIRYDWVDGELTWYDDMSGVGALASRFLCDVGDKW